MTAVVPEPRMISEHELDQIKRGALLVNVARGYARQAVSLFPHSPQAKRILRSCE